MGSLVLGLVLWARALEGGRWVASDRPRASPPSSPTAPDQTTTRWNFSDALNSLDSLSDALNEGDWDGARQLYAIFRQSVPGLPSPELKHPDVSLALVDFFTFYEIELERALAAQQANRALFAANQLGGIIWDLKIHLTRTPLPELGRLHYLSRDLEYWARLGDEEMVRMRAQGLAKAWADLRPVLIDRKGRDVVEELDSLLLRLKRAEDVQEDQDVAADISAVVRQVERIFADIK